VAELAQKDTPAILWDAVWKKFEEEPRLIMRLREEIENRVVYRVFWDGDKPSTVVVAVWKDEDQKEIKFLQEAVAPRKGGVELGAQ